jgi:hypothetical protein
MDKSIPRRQVNSSEGQKQLSEPCDLSGLVLATNSLCPGLSEHTMCETEAQIGNSGLVCRLWRG